MTLPSVDDALADIAGEAVCRCHAAYKDRGVKDPACNHDLAESVEVVRAELLRLARENAELHKSALGGYEDGWHALRNERDALKSELSELKARIAEAPEWYNHPDWVGVGPSGVLTGLKDKRVLLLLVEESIKPK